MFTNEDDGFQELFARLLAYSSTKQSVKMSESKRQTRRDDPMDVDALSTGKSKGKGKKGPVGSGKGNTGQNQMSNVKCWNCGKSGHHASDCREKWSGDRGSGKSKGGKGKVGNGKVKGQRQRQVEQCRKHFCWQEGWFEAGTSHREQGEEHADGWWNEEHVDGWWKDEQTGSSSRSGWWMIANDRTLGTTRTSR